MSATQTQPLYPQTKQPDYPAWEREILAYWEEQGIFDKSVTSREGKPTFTFYEGPPSANGSPGIHHVMARAIKDTFCRYKTLRGYQVHRKGGWDTHGLPIELAVEKTLGITKKDIGTKISVDEYNLRCRQEVMKYKTQWDDLTRQMGYWVDLNNPYITFTNEYIESVWHLLKRMYDKQLLYKGYTIQPYSPAAGTGLSSHELNQPGAYRMVKDTSAIAMFKLVNPVGPNDGVPEYMLAWTTTPWTLPANAALAVGGSIIYFLVETFNAYTRLPIRVWLAEDRLNAYFAPETEVENPFFNSIPETNSPLDVPKEWPKDFRQLPWKKVISRTGLTLSSIQRDTNEYLRYEPLFAGLPVVDAYRAANAQAFRVIAGDFVTTEDGTGVVHISPTFGADDKRAADAVGIPGVLVEDEPIVDRQGKYSEKADANGTPLLGQWAGRYVKNYTDDPNYKELDVDLVIWLKEQNKCFRSEKYEHNYPHCWRTDKPVLYYPLDSWFVATSRAKDKLVAKNREINWKPASTGTGRFGNWLENLVDWNLSRSRYWGIPLPIWASEDRQRLKCIGSVAELKSELEHAIAKGVEVEANTGFLDKIKSYQKEAGDQAQNLESSLSNLTLDLHRPYIDSVVLADAQGRPLRREPDLIDVWFDSGSMPFAQWHYPFENQELFRANYPADFIAEGVDQTRGWFFTLHAISVLLEDSVAYKNVIANGLVLDKDGNKMSKRLGNAVDPFSMLNKYGADSVRWYMLENSPPWENLRFNEDHLLETQRKFFGTLLNSYNFFALYANIDGWQAGKSAVAPDAYTELDRWVLSVLHSLVQEVQAQYDDYDPTRAARAIQYFVVEQLSNWYVRLGRRRFWKGEMNPDKEAAYHTLHTCLSTVAQLMSPIAPFYSDWLYRALNPGADSVHLSTWPVAHTASIDPELEARMAWAMQICSLGHSIRKKAKIKARQPLTKVMVPVMNDTQRSQVEAVAELVQTEINVKAVEVIDAAGGKLSKKIKPNFKTLGPKLGPQMKALAAVVAGLTQADILTLESRGTLELTLEGAPYVLLLEDVELTTDDIPGWSVASEAGVTVALDITLTEELLQEGLARDLVNRIQNLRKELGFEVTDHIHIVLQPVDTWVGAAHSYKDYICAETLADSLKLETPSTETTIEIDGTTGRIYIERV